MHMADALLSPAVGATLWTGTLGAIAYCTRKLRNNIDEKIIPLMGILGAFIFAAQMINFTIPGTGSSGHIGGGMLLAILLGPYAGFITIASVLIIQSLFFADGGILALGCNIWNLGIYPCFIAYPLIFKLLVKEDLSKSRITLASVMSVVTALQLGAFSVVVETLLSGRSELPFGAFTAMMLPIHLAIGLVEGFITAGVVNYVRSARPEIIKSTFDSKPLAPAVSIRKVVLTLGIAALITGGSLSWFASTHPDGLEWSVEKVHGSPELSSSETGITAMFEKIQTMTALLPDYGFRQEEGAEGTAGAKSWPAVNSGTSISGVIGSLMVLGTVL
ncbi:MAG TPA: cobalamin biosynthesis protein CbiM, partial [Nitrospirae bacterium]|nr:cobalamin biosynthesis protein CbiM [Nitrospirota bacterium]